MGKRREMGRELVRTDEMKASRRTTVKSLFGMRSGQQSTRIRRERGSQRESQRESERKRWQAFSQNSAAASPTFIKLQSTHNSHKVLHFKAVHKVV